APVVLGLLAQRAAGAEAGRVLRRSRRRRFGGLGGDGVVRLGRRDRGGRLLGSALRRHGLLRLHLSPQAVAVGLPPHPVGLGVLDARRVALHADPERFAEVERLLVGEPELACKLVDPDPRCQSAASVLSMLFESSALHAHHPCSELWSTRCRLSLCRPTACRSAGCSSSHDSPAWHEATPAPRTPRSCGAPARTRGGGPPYRSRRATRGT